MVVRGVGGAAPPKAKRIRPLAGLIVIALVVLAAGYMQHGLKNRRMKKTAQADAPRTAAGPATVSEKNWMSDQTRLGLDTGNAHVPASMQPRSSITDGTADSIIASRPGAGRSPFLRFNTPRRPSPRLRKARYHSQKSGDWSCTNRSRRQLNPAHPFAAPPTPTRKSPHPHSRLRQPTRCRQFKPRFCEQEPIKPPSSRLK